MLADVKDHFNIKDDELNMQAPNKLTRKICEKQEVRLTDLYSSFRSNPKFPFFFRDEHLNSEGHKLIASEITKALTNEKDQYIAFSRFNKNERYPTLKVLYLSRPFKASLSLCFKRQPAEIANLAVILL